jgi:GTPase SAR1 family protein
MLRIKIACIGNSGAGKTRTIDWFSGSPMIFSQPASVALRFSAYDASNNRLEMWEISGHLRFSSLLPMYLKNAQLVLMVLRSNQEEDIQYFEKLKKELSLNDGGKTKFILAVNSCENDKSDYEDIYSKNQGRFSSIVPQIEAVVKINSRTGEGIDLLKRTLFEKGLECVSDLASPDLHGVDSPRKLAGNRPNFSMIALTIVTGLFVVPLFLLCRSFFTGQSISESFRAAFVVTAEEVSKKHVAVNRTCPSVQDEYVGQNPPPVMMMSSGNSPGSAERPSQDPSLADDVDAREKPKRFGCCC